MRSAENMAPPVVPVTVSPARPIANGPLLRYRCAMAGCLDTQAPWGPDPVLWCVDEFPEVADLAGTDGWSNGYAADPWTGAYGRAYTDTDHATTAEFGLGTAADNWLIRGEPLAQ